jgi:hypothetical protein
VADFRCTLSSGAAFVYSFFLNFRVYLSLNFSSFFVWTMAVAATFMCVDISSYTLHTPLISLLSGYLFRPRIQVIIRTVIHEQETTPRPLLSVYILIHLCLAWWWPIYLVETNRQTIRRSQAVCCVWLKTSTDIFSFFLLIIDRQSCLEKIGYWIICGCSVLPFDVTTDRLSKKGEIICWYQLMLLPLPLPLPQHYWLDQPLPIPLYCRYYCY